MRDNLEHVSCRSDCVVPGLTTVLHPFGTGLRYAEWETVEVTTSRQQLHAHEVEDGLGQTGDSSSAVLHVGATVRNLGSHQSSNPLLLFAMPPAGLATAGTPLRSARLPSMCRPLALASAVCCASTEM